MKRIYKGSDLVFNLSVNNIPINMKLIKSIKFKFYTLNPTNYIEKSESDVDKDNQIVLQWHELENLEQGVLYYDYIVSLLDESMIDKSRDNVEKIMTDFYIVTHIEGSDINLRTVKWGNVVGDINLLLDLIDYIKTQNYTKEQSDAIFATKNELSNELAVKQNTLVSGNNIKTINGESLLGYTDIETATPKDIVITQNLIKQVAQTKANKSYVEELATDKLNKVDAVGIKYPNSGEMFNCDDVISFKTITFMPNNTYQFTIIPTESLALGIEQNLMCGFGLCETSWVLHQFFKAILDENNQIKPNLSYKLRIFADGTIIARGINNPPTINRISKGEYNIDGIETNLIRFTVSEFLSYDEIAFEIHWAGVEPLTIKIPNSNVLPNNIANGIFSHAEGEGTITNNLAEHAEGKYNNSSPNTISSVGIGENNGYRKNAVEIMKDGKAYFLDLGGYNGRINPSSRSIQDVIKNLTERITYLESIITNGTINCGNASTK